MRKLAHTIEPDLHRIRLDSPGGLVVNVYALIADGAPVLFDTGFPYTTDKLDQGLGEIGYSLSDVEHIFYTHTHIDHMGGGAALGDSLTAQQHVWSGTPEQACTDYFGWYRRHRYPSQVFEEILPHSELSRQMLASMHQQPDSNRPAGQGHLAHIARHDFDDCVTVGAHRFRCIDLRGHDPFHCGWIDEDTGYCFCGDAIMRVISPIMPHMDDDLRLWMKTTQSVRTQPIQRLLPGHGMPSTLVAASFDRSEKFIETLYDLAVEAFDEGLPVDPIEVALTYLGDDRSRYHAQLVVFAGTTYSIFAAMDELGLVKRLPSRHWTTSRALPPYAEFRKSVIDHS